MKFKKLQCLVLLSLTLVISSCTKDNEPDKPNENEICYEYTGKPAQAIAPSLAKQLQTHYLQTRVDGFNQFLQNAGILSSSEQEVRDVTFNFLVLRNYMNYVEKLAKEKGIDVEDLALRVYQGAYPNGFSAPGFSQQNEGRATVFFMPVNSTKTVNKSSLKKQLSDDIIDGIDGLNLGQSGFPPKDLN